MTVTISAAQSPTNSTTAINAILAGGANRYILPAGNYTCDLSVPNGVSLVGDGQGATAIVGTVSYASGATYAEVQSMSINAGNNPVNTLTAPSSAVACIGRDLLVVGGQSALYTTATDCCFENCAFMDSYGLGAAVSNGASWYVRCKIDSQSSPGGSYYGFYQGDAIVSNAVQENHFDQCDFSGPYTDSVNVTDSYNQAMMVFNGGVMSAGVVVNGCKGVVLSGGCELGADCYTNNGKPLLVDGCFGLSAVVIHGTGKILGTNYNIT